MTKKSSTFASSNEEYEPTALANSFYRDKLPVLTGEAAERFERMARENEKKAKEIAKRPMTKEEAEKRIPFERFLLKEAEKNIKNIKGRIKKLEEIINSTNN